MMEVLEEEELASLQRRRWGTSQCYGKGVAVLVVEVVVVVGV